eukprot:GHRR01033447.1.p2 GENE.GHRR01033447.1~~GHRR01033447.1.p2  ORF type:complete len:102 (-),score=36.44 GHRR01033447.1:767-1072(-)
MFACVLIICYLSVLQPPAAARQKDKFVPLGQTLSQPQQQQDESSSSSSQARSQPWPIQQSQLTYAQRGGGVDADAAAKKGMYLWNTHSLSSNGACERDSLL